MDGNISFFSRVAHLRTQRAAVDWSYGGAGELITLKVIRAPPLLRFVDGDSLIAWQGREARHTGHCVSNQIKL